MTLRIGFLLSHPIQYYAPVFRALAADGRSQIGQASEFLVRRRNMRVQVVDMEDGQRADFGRPRNRKQQEKKKEDSLRARHQSPL